MRDDFDGDALDRSVWLPHYLPAWSSRAASRASYSVHDSCLDLFIPVEQGLWCAGEHQPPLRVSGVQSGSHSGPLHSTVGQQPFRPGLTVREEQETFWGWTPRFGRIEITARMWLSPRSIRRSVTFDVDGVETRTCARPPTYPMQLMLAVFDFPERAAEADRKHVPRLLVDRVAG